MAEAFDSGSGYVALVGQEAQNRLELQNQLFQNTTKEWLITAGIKKGMTVLDIGCGTGAVSRQLAEMVGETGQVIGLDISSEQLEVAKKLSTSYHNISYIEGSVMTLEDFLGLANFVYSRFLLMHLHDPLSALKQMITCLKPGGILVCAEPETSKSHCKPQSEAFQSCLDLMLNWSRKVGVDYDIGSKLEFLLEQLPVINIINNTVQPSVKSQNDKKIALMFLDEMRSLYLNADLVNEAELNHLQKRIAYEVVNNNSRSLNFCLLHQVAAQLNPLIKNESSQSDNTDDIV